MAFRLKSPESANKGIKRIIHREIGHAANSLIHIRDKEEAIHDVRVHCKKIRAVLRLARAAIGDSAYHRENEFFRDMARPLTEMRDAKVLIKTLDRLTHDFPSMRKAFQNDYQKICQYMLKENHAFDVIFRKMKDAERHIKGWHPYHGGWKKARHGLRHTYRQGRRAFAVAVKHPTNEHLHEWRKQSKYLWYQLKILEAVHPKKAKASKQRCHQLEKCLGDDHDLAMLREAMPGGSHAVKPLFTLIDQRRKALQKKARRLGKHIYRKRSKAFLKLAFKR